jgi:hypothetical protein
MGFLRSTTADRLAVVGVVQVVAGFAAAYFVGGLGGLAAGVLLAAFGVSALFHAKRLGRSRRPEPDCHRSAQVGREPKLMRVVDDAVTLSISLDVSGLVKRSLFGNIGLFTVFLGIPILFATHKTAAAAVFFFWLIVVVVAALYLRHSIGDPWIRLDRRANQFQVNNTTLCSLDDIVQVRLKTYAGEDPDLQILLRDGVSHVIRSSDHGPYNVHIEEAARRIASFLRVELSEGR